MQPLEVNNYEWTTSSPDVKLATGLMRKQLVRYKIRISAPNSVAVSNIFS
jgi:hypothetical protein